MITSPQRRFVEQVGLATESDGLSRIAGRLFAELMLSEGPRSLDELAETLGVSKASVSTDARRLLTRGIAERIGQPGDRRDYYQLAPDFFERIIRSRAQRWAQLQRFVAELRASDATLPAAIRTRLTRFDDFHAFILERIESAVQEWEARQAAPARASRRGETARV